MTTFRLSLLIAMLAALGPAHAAPSWQEPPASERWQQMDPEQRARAERKLQQLQQLSPQQRQELRRKAEQFRSLPESEQEELLQRRQWYRELPESERERLRRDWHRQDSTRKR
jgi:hypothetical protein